jgi:hypothetical protein
MALAPWVEMILPYAARALAAKHLSNSLHMFSRLIVLARPLDRKTVEEMIAARGCEELDSLIIGPLMERQPIASQPGGGRHFGGECHQLCALHRRIVRLPY